MPSRDSSSRTKSSRSSRRADRDRNRDHSPSAYPYQNSVRAAESRFSLTDQFATTRREFEFGFDDASSIFTRVTDAVESHIQPPSDDEGDGPATDPALRQDPSDETAAVQDTEDPQDENTPEDADYEASDYYDLLCLPRGDALTQEHIRAAFYRHFMMLYPEMHPSKHRAMAALHFQRSQQAYEVLMDPQRRATYDLFGDPGAAANIRSTYDSIVESKLRDKMQQAVYGSSEVGLRVDASRLYAQIRKGKVPSADDVVAGIKPLDYALSQSFTIGVPVHRLLPLAHLQSMKKCAWEAVPSFRKKPDDKEKEKEPLLSVQPERTYYMAVPTVTVAASLYGLVEGFTQANPSSSLLTDRFQPLLPLTIPRHRIAQLGELRCTPLIAVRMRQEFIHKARTANDTHWTKSAIEIESNVLPDRALTARVSHTFILPHGSVPWNIEASATNGRAVTGGVPRLGVGIYRPLCGGTAFVRADSGDWRFGNGAVCRFFDRFSRESKKWFYAEFQFPLKTTPNVEVGYKTTRCERWATTSYADIPRGESGVRGMDREASFSGNGSWAVSASAMPGDVFAGYLRYSRDIPYLAPAQTPSRVEVEVSGNPVAEHYFALRNLWQVGQFSRLGLEVGVSQYHFHVSLYWSRLSQAVSLPLLVSPRSQMNEKAVFWSAVAPFVTIAAFQLGSRWLHSGKRKAKIAKNELAIQQYVAQKRTEAEEIEYLMEDYVEDRQKREAKKGGLVILSAKYGVKEGDRASTVWAGQEVADVKVAVAALVDMDGRLEIPEGVRKSHIPGFWDPMPLQEKVLHIRYLYRGKEGAVEVRGREGLVLPPLYWQ
ncbi:hypothetical protein TD95_001113 [Thielaviopsis punctulata]|uniref:J domain-containing protein n=1 Tax=Thielaviopsis punctulata TaxID=72032 RepID=A0A0F4ZL39_9PEZI|nr:hypothetical protein TD95_001113 [Thielaviopsis punctulata]